MRISDWSSDVGSSDRKYYNSQHSQRRKAGNDKGRISLLVKTHNDGIRSAKLRKSQQNQEGVGKRRRQQKAVKTVEQTAVPGKQSSGIFYINAALKHGLHEVSHSAENNDHQRQTNPIQRIHHRKKASQLRCSAADRKRTRLNSSH